MSLKRHVRMAFWSQPREWAAAGVYPTHLSMMELEGRRSPWVVDFHCIHLVLRGPLRFYSRTGTLTDLEAGEMFLIEPHVPFYYHAVGERCAELYAMRLDGPLVQSYVGLLGFGPDTVHFQAVDPEAVQRSFRKMMKLAKQEDPSARFEVVAQLQALPPFCRYEPESAPGELPLADRVVAAMRSRMEEGLNVEELSREFGVSRYTLFQHFRERFGESPVKVLTRMRLERSRHLLGDTLLPVVEVARLCGYRNVEHFHRQFRESAGLTPLDWRAGHQQKASMAAERAKR